MIKRYLDDGIFKRFIEDFGFLFQIIKDSSGEFDIRLRDNYINLYYKGYSLAKVNLKKLTYAVSINRKFAADIHSGDKRFASPVCEGDYCVFSLSPELLHPFFQAKYLKKLCSNIQKVNAGAEVTFEQMLITDNLDNDRIFIIDRQITETALKRKRVDLLALSQVEGNQYRFLVIEVKLGNNPELKRDVGEQLKSYIGHINAHFKEWKDCYERNYLQVKETGIFDRPLFRNVEILEGAKGLVVVGGYSGIGRKSIDELKKSYPEIEVKSFVNTL